MNVYDLLFELIDEIKLLLFALTLHYLFLIIKNGIFSANRLYDTWNIKKEIRELRETLRKLENIFDKEVQLV